jgi:hypothetical protein
MYVMTDQNLERVKYLCFGAAFGVALEGTIVLLAFHFAGVI